MQNQAIDHSIEFNTVRKSRVLKRAILQLENEFTIFKIRAQLREIISLL